MRTVNSRLLLIDVHSSWQSANQIPISTFAYLRKSNLVGSSISAALRRARRRHSRISSSRSPVPSIQSPEIRRPNDWSKTANRSLSVSTNLPSTSSSRDEVVTDLDLFLEIVPLKMRNELYRHEEIGKLIEVVMDLGRKPLARFPSGDWMISDQPVKIEDLLHAISKVGDFSDDNRSGINSSLHRISAIRNRKMQIIGLTCRVGRAVSGSAEIVRDLIQGGGSILVIGPPGVGKTTLIREIARMLADDQRKRVVIVDTSNEIGGDGDIPHSGIGQARRMQVPNVNLQHNVMIEAVENHMPEVIVIDEIGTELEALAASTIAQRGVQLVGTAHGMTIENIIKNPSLQILVGGIESVTLGDEEARKRKVQKTILERKGPPAFTCAVEMISRTECRVHHRLDATVDAILAGKSPLYEMRRMKEDNSNAKSSLADNLGVLAAEVEDKDYDVKSNADDVRGRFHVAEEDEDYYFSPKKLSTGESGRHGNHPVLVYTYKIQDADVVQVANVMGLQNDIDATDDIDAADVILASRDELKQNPSIRGVARFHQLPIFVIKSNTMAQMVKAVRKILSMHAAGPMLKSPAKDPFHVEIEDDAPKRKPSVEEIDALEEVRLAIEYIVIPGGEPVELLPRSSEIVARQLELVESYQLAVENSGTELSPRLQILPQRSSKKTLGNYTKYCSSISKDARYNQLTAGGGGTSIARLPILPE